MKGIISRNVHSETTAKVGKYSEWASSKYPFKPAPEPTSPKIKSSASDQSGAAEDYTTKAELVNLAKA